MVEDIILNIIYKMDSYLNGNQLSKLKDVLFTEFYNKEIIDNSNKKLYKNYIIDENQIINNFKISKKISGRQESTLNQYIREIKTCKKIINKNFNDITTMDIIWYFSKLKEEHHICMNTLKTRKNYLNSFWTFLVNENYVKNNPILKMDDFKINLDIKEPFSEIELESLKMSCSNERDRALIGILYSTGIRVSELCKLNIKDIDLYNKEFKVIGKGNKERLLYISDSEYLHLYNYLKIRSKQENKPLSEILNEPLFTTIKKPYNRITIAGVQWVLKKIGEKSNIKDIHPHRFRRTFASNLLEKGMKLEEVKTLMGHSKVDTTMIYCNIKQEKIKQSYKQYIR